MGRIIIPLLFSALLASCAMPEAVAPTRPLIGTWGGSHVALTLDGQGGRIEYDCAHGSLDAAVLPDPGGAFSVPGTHVREGGPVSIDVPPDLAQARYAGSVRGDRMTLQVQTGAARLGPFALQRGAPAQLFKCL